MSSVVHRLLDGSQVTIRASFDLDEAFSSYARIDFGSDVQEFGAGPGEFGVTDAYDIGVKEFHEEYRFQGGTLRLGTAHRLDTELKDSWTYLVAVWQGTRYSLSTYLANQQSNERMLASLNKLRLSETTEGLVAMPIEPMRTPVVKASLLKAAPQLRLIDIRRREPNELRPIPNWAGQHVDGGELFLLGSHDKPTGFVLVRQPHLV